MGVCFAGFCLQSYFQAQIWDWILDIPKSQRKHNSSTDPSDSGINSDARGGQILQRFIGDVMNLRNKNKELNPFN